MKTLKGKKAVICVGGGSMKRFGFLQKAQAYLEEAGMEVALIEGIEPDPSVTTVMKGAEKMLEFQPDWIIAMGGGSPIDAAKAMWIKYEYPECTFEDMCKIFGIPELRKKAKFVAEACRSYRYGRDHTCDRSVCLHSRFRFHRRSRTVCYGSYQG